MAVTHEATEVVLSPQRDYRGLIRAIVAVLAAFVIGMMIGNVIDGSDDGTQAATEGGAVAPALPTESATPAETFSPELVRGLAQRPQAAAVVPDLTFSPELVRGLAQRPQAPAVVPELRQDQLTILLDSYALPEIYRQDLAARVARGADFLPAQRAAADRLQGLAETYEQGLTTGSVVTGDDAPTDIWQVRPFGFVSTGPSAAAQQAATERLNGLAEFHSVPSPSEPVPDRPHGMQ